MARRSTIPGLLTSLRSRPLRVASDQIFKTTGGAGNVNTSFAQFKALAARYTTVIDWRSAIALSAQAAATYVIDINSASLLQAANNNSGLSVVYLDPADEAVSGLSGKYRFDVSFLSNSIGAGTVTFTFGLYPVTACAGAGGALTITLGTVVAGSTVAVVNPAASARVHGNSGAFTPPAAGFFAPGVVISAGCAANSVENMAVRVISDAV